ncbi:MULTISPECIES: hypothetical protein [unclassified Bradyrhizobium]|uniref:hypothetical protein n=1 Tax=unclassified Bradyrhizobium TaxID=2631580 RepID=UPI0033962245
MNRFVRIAAICSALGLAAYSESIPALFIAIIRSVIFWQNHVLEVKLNRLLDDHQIYVTKADIAAG